MEILDYVGKTVANVVIGLPTATFYCGVSALKTVGGVAGTALSLLTFGKVESINNLANYTDHARKILPQAYLGLASVVNPSHQQQQPRIGVITAYIATPIFTAAGRVSCDENSFLMKHIVSRGAYALGALVSVVTRTADLVLGLIAATLSIIPCMGRVKGINNIAVNQLSSLAVIHDVCCGLRGFVNPQQFRAQRLRMQQVAHRGKFAV